ncbi:MAG: fibrobacter succinogenes major paralogous domain-containing protein [Bacteroidales bacterium]|jgi:uncharacterized protein (TIGR02145 family)|nr:fibrobacter succinogenes major paralogous domain-containing protein [Bacteroidales bacterium]
MAENLRTTKYNDGTPIPNVKDKDAWGNSEIGKYCWYNNSTNYEAVFGALYNYYTVNTDKLCPSGWHVSSDDDWKTLGNELGMNSGIKLKEAGTTHWKTSTNATNETGFPALPGGLRYNTGNFTSVNTMGAWWTSFPVGVKKAFGIVMYTHKSPLEKPAYEMSSGLSVRCVKD